MRKVVKALAVVLALGFLLGASPGAEGEGDPAEGEGAPGAEGAPGGEGAVGTEADEGDEAGGVGIRVAEHETLGPYLTDAEGNSLYLYLTDAEGVSSAQGDTAEGEGDPAEGEGAPGAEGAPGGEGALGTEGVASGSGSGVSTCYDRCAESWPPLVAEGEPGAGEGVAADLLGTTDRQDGSTQVTYNGWPLYRFSRDIPAFAGGQGAGGTWYLVSPDGQALGAQAEPEEEAAASEEAEGAADPMVAGALAGEGRSAYETNCAACHGAQGDGGRGPSLAGNANLSDTQTVVRQIINGAPPYMPKFGDQLSDAEIAAVASFIRTAWGNELGEVTEEEVGNIAGHP